MRIQKRHSQDEGSAYGSNGLVWSGVDASLSGYSQIYHLEANCTIQDEIWRTFGFAWRLVFDSCTVTGHLVILTTFKALYSVPQMMRRGCVDVFRCEVDSKGEGRPNIVTVVHK